MPVSTSTVRALALSLGLLSTLASAGLFVQNPSSLRDALDGDEGEVKSKLSNVGMSALQRGGSRIGQVITPLSDDQQGCQELNWERDFTVKEMEHFDKTQGFFLLLQRGGCSFDQKVKNAQLFGAEVVIISDYRSEEQEQEALEKGLAGTRDGSLHAHIPAFEIDWDQAKQIVDVIRMGEDVVYMRATLDVTSYDNTVEVDLWYSTSLDLGLALSTELAAMSLTFQADHAQKPLFTPRIATYSCLGCTEEFRAENCYGNGVYCAYTPNFFKEYDLDSKEVSLTGREVLMQALREKCLHQIMSSKYHDEGDLFWTFFGYLDKCFVESKFSTKGGIAHSLAECYDWSTVLIQGNEEVGALEECVEGSFETAGDFESENAILRADRVWAESNNIQLHPSVTINNITYTNSTGQDLALAICAAYREAPDECELSWEIKTFYKDEGKFEGLLTPHEEDRLYQEALKEQESEYQQFFSSWRLYALIVGILVVNFAAMLVVRWRMKRQMRSQMNDSVQAAVSQYFALSGQGDD